jgi:hypothetical protein
MKTNDHLEQTLVRFWALLTFAFVVARSLESLQRMKPFFDFFIAVMFVCFGPYLLALAFKMRDTETGTIWRKSWPVGIILGIGLPVTGVVMFAQLLKQ